MECICSRRRKLNRLKNSRTLRFLIVLVLMSLRWMYSAERRKCCFVANLIDLFLFVTVAIALTYPVTLDSKIVATFMRFYCLW